MAKEAGDVLRGADLSGIRPDPQLVGRRITADYVADDLREAIQSGVLEDGAVLNQAALAAHFGVSRVPVREAMRQLQAEGLIDAEAHQLAVVRGLSLERIAEAYDNRALLEGYLTERAVPRLTAESIEELREAERIMRPVADHAEWLRLNTAFHHIILQAAGDETGLELVALLRTRSQRYVRMWSGHEGTHQPVDAGREHVEIIECIAAGDPAAARLSVERHIRHTGERLVAHGRRLRAEAHAGSF
jgi:DNA-binding GntR family transcriptional regulator